MIELRSHILTKIHESQCLAYFLVGSEGGYVHLFLLGLALPSWLGAVIPFSRFGFVYRFMRGTSGGGGK